MSRLARHGIGEVYRMRETGRAEVNNIAQKAKLRLKQIPMTIQERVKYQEQVADDLEKNRKEVWWTNQNRHIACLLGQQRALRLGQFLGIVAPRE